MAEFFVDNNVIHYEIIGASGQQQRTPILMLHGNGENMHYFDDVISRFTDSKFFILMDSRLQGESHLSEGGSIRLSFDRMADDAIALMNHLNIHEYYVVGYSDGGIIAMLMAMKTYDIMKIIAIGINSNPDGLTSRAVRQIKSSYRKAKRKHDEIGMELNRLMLQEPNITLRDLSRIVAEVTILLGQKDKMIDAKQSEAIANALPHCSHIIIPGAGHDIVKTHASQLADYIRTLL